MFAKMVDLCDLGLFIVGIRGRGKTTILDTIRDCLSHRDIMEVSILTYAGLNKMAGELSNRNVTMINRDFSSFYTDYLKDVAVNMMSTLITDHSIKADTGKYHIKIDNCTISFLSATQPQMLEKINRIPAWESMYRDRFLRYPMLYWFGSPEYRDDPPKVLPVELIPDINSVTITKSVKQKPEYNRMLALIERQTSGGRCRQYLDALLKASAAINERDIVIEKDLKFLQLFAGNLVTDYLLSDRKQGVSRSLVLNSDSYIIFSYLLEIGGASKSDMREEWSVSNVTMQKNLNPLMAKNLIKGSFGKDWYAVNPTWIERYAKPVYEWFEEAGIHA